MVAPDHLALFLYNCANTETEKQALLLHARHILDNVDKDFNSFQKNLFIEKLVMVV